MTVSPKVDSPFHNCMFRDGFKLLPYVATLAGNLTVDKSFPPLLVLDPGGAARTVTLPAEADSEGLVFLIVNTADAAEALTIEDDAAGSVGSIAQNEMGLAVCDGTAWHLMVGANT